MHDELIERLENATGPDRRLDAEIAAAVGFMYDFDPTQFIVAPTYRVSDDELRVEAWTQVGDQPPWRQASRLPPPYTSSIDAALTLVPEGFIVHCDIDVDGKSFCFLHSNAPIIQTHAPGATCLEDRKPPAIALCIAALKAHEVQQRSL